MSFGDVLFIAVIALGLQALTGIPAIGTGIVMGIGFACCTAGKK